MLATGGLLVGIALLTLGVVAPLFRSSNPPRWTTYGWVGEVVTLAIVCTFALGVGYLGAGAIEVYQTGVDYLDLALLVGIVGAGILARRWWRARARPGVPGADLRVVVPESGDLSGGGRVPPIDRPAVSPSPPQPHRAA